MEVTNINMNKTVVALMAVALTLGFATTAAAEETDDATIDGGDVEVNDLVEEADSEEWAGFYGNLEVATTLADGDDTLLDWTVEDQTGSVVYAAEADTGLDLEALGALNEEEVIDGLEGVPEGNEAPSELYTEQEGKEEEEEGVELDPTASLTTEGDFQNFLFSTEEDNVEDGSAVFASEVLNNEDGFNEEGQHDYEVLVGKEEFDEDESWDFYVEIA